MQPGFFTSSFVGVNDFVAGGAVENALGFKEGGLSRFFVFGCNRGLQSVQRFSKFFSPTVVNYALLHVYSQGFFGGSYFGHD